MRLKNYGIAALVLLALAFGCVTPEEQFSPEQQKALDKAKALKENKERYRNLFDRVHDLIASGKIPEAKVMLAPLKTVDFSSDELMSFRKELTVIEAAIAQAETLQNHKANNAVSERTMFNEAEAAMSLPSTYGKTVVIDAKLPDLKMPEGSMEKMLNSKVSINLDNAGIAELVGALKSSCKLNVIADDALAESKTLTIAVDDVPLKEVLSYVSRNMGVAFHLGENVLWITRSDESNSGPHLATRIIRLRQGTIPSVPQGGTGANGEKMGSIGNVELKEDNELDEALTALMADSPEGASFKLFKDRNILVIRDTLENLRLAEKIVEEFDKAPYQVCIEARFLAVSQDDLRDIGTELTQKTPIAHHGETEPGSDVYDDKDRNEALKAVNSLTELGILKAGAEEGLGAINFSGVLGDRTFDILISALEKKASTVTLSVPKVTVLNNRQARIRKGSSLYYFEEYDVVTVDGGDESGDENVLAPTGKPTILPLGLTFDVKVNVGNDGKSVLLGLKPEIVEFEKWEDYQYTTGDDDDDDDDDDDEATVGTIKLPRTYEQSVVTSVNVASGQTVVLGGMLENQKGKTVTQVPFLGDLPLIGWLFKHEKITYTPTNLLIFVTATVINDKGEFVEVK